MSKFFIDINENNAIITGEDYRHLTGVLRVKLNDTLKVCDGVGFDYDGEIIKIDKNCVYFKLSNKKPSQTEAKIKTTLYQSFPKGEKTDFIIQKTVEMGIDGIVFFISERSIVKIDEKSIVTKLNRFNQISKSAAKQSGRGKIPVIRFLPDLTSVLNEIENGIILYEGNRSVSLKNYLPGNKNIKNFSYIIGPEGGFDEKEIKQCIDNSILPVNLGKRILRAETAALVVLTAFMYEFDEI